MNISSSFPKNTLAVAVMLSTMSGAANAQLEEVIVSAQKIDQSLQDVPAAIIAFNAEAIQDLGIESFDALDGFVPNAHISKGNQAGQALVAIRGVTGATDSTSTSEPGVGLYMNGVYISKNMGALFDTAALERVEVIKGPQGTLFGKNTIGGAISMVTKKPSGKLEGEIGGTVGSEDLAKGKVLLNLPAVGVVGEGMGQLSSMVALTYTEFDSTIDNPLADASYGAEESSGALIRLVLDVSEQFSVDYIFDHADTDYSTPNYQLIAAVPGLLGNQLLGQEDAHRRSSFSSDSFVDDNNSEVTGHALTLTYDISDALSIKSISARRKTQVHEIFDLDGTAEPALAGNTILGDIEMFTQEFQLVGVGDNYQFVAGLYYFEEDGEDQSEAAIRFVPGLPPINTGVTTVETQNDAVAIFGQATWEISEAFALTGGLRYTEETREMVTSSVPGEKPSEDYDNFSPMISLSWKPSEDHHVYLKYSEGWRSGGFDGRAASVAALKPFDEETVASYELGLKSYFLDRMIRLNVAAFFNEYDDRQVGTAVITEDLTITTVVDNAGKSEMAGVELELTALATPNLELTASYGYLDAEYTEFLTVDAGRNVIDVKDNNTFTFSPEHSLHLSAKYSFQGLSWGVPSARIDYSWKDDYVTERLLTSEDIATQEAHGLLSARLEVAEIPLGNGSFRASLWGKNLTDEDVKFFTIDARSALGTAAARWNDHATYGLDLSYAF